MVKLEIVKLFKNLKENGMALVPEYIKDLKPYVPGRSIDEIKGEYNLEKIYKLASNENPLGPSPMAVEAMGKAFRELHRYPDIGATKLREKLAEMHGLKIGNVAVGNGSEGIMATILRCFLCDDDEMITSEATFIGFQVLSKGRGNKCIEVPMPKDTYKFDLKGIAGRINEKTKLIYLCNPNNPTGTIFTKSEFDEFMDLVPERVIVILDEAYFEYVPSSAEYPDSMDYRHDNVITLRTFSKAYGIAGARVGYGFAHEEFVENIMKVKLPFEPGNIAQEGACAALDDKEFLERSMEVNKRGYEFLTKEFTHMGLKWFPSCSNFIMIDFDDEETVARVNSSLLQHGVIIRPLKPFGLAKCMRVTIGLEEENDALVKYMKKYV